MSSSSFQVLNTCLICFLVFVVFNVCFNVFCACVFVSRMITLKVLNSIVLLGTSCVFVKEANMEEKLFDPPPSAVSSRVNSRAHRTKHVNTAPQPGSHQLISLLLDFKIEHSINPVLFSNCCYSCKTLCSHAVYVHFTMITMADFPLGETVEPCLQTVVDRSNLIISC